jgi:hypothetical protein
MLVAVASVLGLGVVDGPVSAFDGTSSPSTASLTPNDGLRSPGMPESADKAKSFTALQYAADQGHLVAQWKVGVYASATASRRTTSAPSFISADPVTRTRTSPGRRRRTWSPNANGARALLPEGIPIRRHGRAGPPVMRHHAASCFGDADAQYQLGASISTARRAIRAAARAGSNSPPPRAIAAPGGLGDMLFQGKHVPRQAARGLMWLTLGRDCAGAEDAWVKPLYENAFRRANDDERAMALVFLEGWLKGRRE